MKIRSLKDTSLQEIIDCLLQAFEGYFVQFPSSLEYWHNRFTGARVDFGLSYGAFDNNRLVAFIIHGIDAELAGKVAFNTGTGVLNSYRGQQLVDQLYAYAIPELKEKGVSICKLEVIQDNLPAIRVYERIGFTKTRSLKCFRGAIEVTPNTVDITGITFEEAANQYLSNQNYHSWDNTYRAIEKLKEVYKTYLVSDKVGRQIGYFVVNPTDGYMPQFHCEGADLQLLLNGVSQVATTIKINNIPETQLAIIQGLEKIGLQNTVDQFEMEMAI